MLTPLKFDLGVFHVHGCLLKLFELLRSLNSAACHSSDKEECHELYFALTWPLLECYVPFGDSNCPKAERIGEGPRQSSEND